MSVAAPRKVFEICPVRTGWIWRMTRDGKPVKTSPVMTREEAEFRARHLVKWLFPDFEVVVR